MPLWTTHKTARNRGATGREANRPCEAHGAVFRNPHITHEKTVSSLKWDSSCKDNTGYGASGQLVTTQEMWKAGSEQESSGDKQRPPAPSMHTKGFKMQITGFSNNPGISPGNVFIIHILLAMGAPITCLLFSFLLTNY